jgi:hypothetical protein
MTISFVLGNGTSRAGVNLNTLRLNGKIYGCNALYREFDPDYLISVDQKMVLEIQESNYQKTHSVWTNVGKEVIYDDGFNYFDPPLKWSSGSCALHLASSHNPSKIFILGFDFLGNKGKFNNVYSDTRNYKSSKEMETYYGNWLKQVRHVITTNPSITYYRVISDENPYIPEWDLINLHHIVYNEFYKLIENN